MTKNPRAIRRSRRPLRAVALVGLLGSLPLGALWYVGHSLATRTQGHGARPVSVTQTPVLSVRRAASTLVADSTIRNLRNELSGLVAKLPKTACLRVDAGGFSAVRSNADQSLIPASNTKILTAAVALDTLPPTLRFKTRVIGSVSDGMVNGDLYLVGGGDPLLVTRDFLSTEKYPTTSPTYLDSLADSLKAKGITSVSGSIVGDESYLDDTRYNQDWSSGIRATEAGPLGALMVNDGAVLGDPMKPDNPAVAAAREFTRLLVARGITVSGQPRAGVAGGNETNEIASIESATIGKVVGEMLTNSDNNTAEILVRHIGLAKSLQPTTSAGLKVIGDTLKSWGLTDVKLHDGSGLSRNNRIPCDAIVSVLDRQPINGDLVAGLSVAARTGTLADAFKETSVAGKLRGKTGTLLNVKTLGGVLPVSANDAVTFALFLNGAGWADQGNYRPLWDALANAIATYPKGPDRASVAVN